MASTSNFVVSSGGNLVLVEGVFYNGMVLSGGTVTLDGRATAEFTHVSSGGEEIVSGEVVANGSGGLEGISGFEYEGEIFPGAEQLVSNGVTSGEFIDDGTQILEGTLISGFNLYGASVGATLDGGLEQVGYLGFGSNTTVMSGGELEVLPGGLIEGATVQSGGILVLSGGFASASTIESGGTLIVNVTPLTALQSGTIVDPGATVISTGVVHIIPFLPAEQGFLPYSYTVSAYATVATGLEAYYKGDIDVLDSGVLNSTGIENDESVTVMQGGTANGNVVHETATLDVQVGASASNTTLLASAVETLDGLGTANESYAGTDYFATISGGTQLDEGMAMSASVYAGGVQSVTDYGLASGTVIHGSGVVSADSGGGIYSAVISSGGVLALGYTGNAQFVTVSSAGIEFVGNQSDDDQGSIANGGLMVVLAGGFTLDDTVLSGGFKVVSSGGVGQADVISSGGSETVEVGGTVSATTVLSGGTLIVYGSAEAITVESGGFEIYGGGTVTVAAGQTVTSAAFKSATVAISSGGKTADVSILGGSNLTVYNGAFALNDLVLGTPDVTGGAATQTISSGGMASGTDIQQAGVENVESGGVASASMIESAGTQGVDSGGSSFAATVMIGGVQDVSQGSAYDTTVQFGATQYVGAGGTAIGTTVDSGALQEVESPVAFIGLVTGGTAISANILDGGEQDVASGASAAFTSLGSATETDLGVTTGTIVGNGGALSAGGVAGEGTTSATQIQSGGAEYIEYGAVAHGSIVSSGGTQIITPGGTAYATTVLAGGMQEVEGGAISGGTVAAGGTQILFDATLSGTVTYALSATLVNSNNLVASGATISVAGTFENDGVAELDPTALTVGSLTGSGTIEIDAGSYLEVVGSASALQTVDFTGASGEFKIDRLAGMQAVVSGFGPGDTIDFANIGYDPAGSAVSADGVLSVTEGGTTYQLGLAGDDAADMFQLAPDASSGTVLTAEMPCFLAGTRLSTPDGEALVESLAIGDLLICASGRAAPIRWVGRRSYAGRFLAANPAVQPIRFRAGSLGDGLPHRDLLVSPLHAMLIDAVLVPARCLVNGTTIVQETHCRQVDYFHVELAEHDILLAEGAASESFLDDDSRGMFHNASEFASLYPDASASGRYCAPRVTEGYQLEEIRRRLAEMAGNGTAAALRNAG